MIGGLTQLHSDPHLTVTHQHMQHDVVYLKYARNIAGRRSAWHIEYTTSRPYLH